MANSLSIQAAVAAKIEWLLEGKYNYSQAAGIMTYSTTGWRLEYYTDTLNYSDSVTYAVDDYGAVWLEIKNKGHTALTACVTPEGKFDLQIVRPDLAFPAHRFLLTELIHLCFDDC